MHNAKRAALATRPSLDISSNHAGTFKAKSPKFQGRIEVKRQATPPALRALKRALAQTSEPALKANWCARLKLSNSGGGDDRTHPFAGSP
jgi:hypothetical protein